jgi:tetratricopeptide (TPR) repeat protein
MNEGSAAEAAGDYVRAESLYRAATEIAERFDHRDRRRAVAWNSLATMYDAMGRFADAEAGYRKALHMAAESSGKSGADYGQALANLGSEYVETGQPAAGIKMLREAVAIYSAVEPPDEVRIAVAWNGLAEALCAARKYKEAGPLLTRSLEVLEKRPDAWLDVALAKNNLGVVRFFEGRREESGQLLRQGLAIMEEHLGLDHPMLVKGLKNLASVEALAGHRDGAGEKLRRALEIAERRLGPEHPIYAIVLADYAAYLGQGGDKSRAKALKAQADQIMKDSSLRNGLDARVDIRSLRDK